MSNVLRNFFMFLSKSKLLNNGAKRWGLHLGAQRIIAGTNIDQMVKSVGRLNERNIACTIDNLGEFVFDKGEATEAKDKIVNVIELIGRDKLNAHISLKPSQLGLDIDEQFCLDNLREIVEEAHKNNVFVNFDMENYNRLQPSLEIFEELVKTYNNIGTVIQAYFFRAEDDIGRYRDFRLRIVKGAYKEDPKVAYQHKEKIDENFLKLIQWNLLHGTFTSIATHDHHVINDVKHFVEINNISKDTFEFQMLYGFREEMQLELVKEGYQFCTYVPFGEDWYGYFMRRLAERPQNLNLLLKQMFST